MEWNGMEDDMMKWNDANNEMCDESLKLSLANNN